MMQFTKAELTRIIESADEVITALAGTNDDIHPDNSTKMCAAWDDLNDRNAPPSVVKRLEELALAGMEAQPATVVPDELSEDINDDEYPRAWGYRIGWNACRTAMMNGGVDAQLENESE
ncbi:hypothetical protein [Enterobacter asburiae]|uniref:hypothetical protein n=1 Tax=Enterobacter asburiae TaxID=61645 RepID=UPI002952A9CE|nr:hypothetical protein [Enterobacter asburiae]MDV7001818.1 hypothetical protein [Enterobacter asburiae]